MIALIFVGFLSFLGMGETRTEEEVRKVLEKIEFEVELAKHGEDGYRRAFYLPSAIYGLEFNAHISNFTIFLNLSNRIYTKEIGVERVEGLFKPGENEIVNKGGNLYVL